MQNMCRATNCVSDWPERNRRCPPPPHTPHPPTPNKPLLFFFLKHEFPSYTTHAPLPFSRSLTTCISPLSYPSLLFPPPPPLLSCMFSFFCGYHGIIVFHMTHFFTSQSQTGGKRVKCRLKIHESVSVGEATFPRGGGGGGGASISQRPTSRFERRKKKIQEANYSFPLFAFCFCEPFLRQTLKE